MAETPEKAAEESEKPPPDVVFVFSPERRVRVTATDADWLAHSWLETTVRRDETRKLRTAIRIALRDGSDVNLDTKMGRDLLDVLHGVEADNRLKGFEELYEAAKETYPPR